MSHVFIVGPERIADSAGTHEPGDTVTAPTAALLELATAKTLNPDSGKPYATLVDEAPPATPPAAAPPPAAVQNVQVSATDNAGSKEKA